MNKSALFDPDWYLQQYPDVKLLEMDPLEHFLRIGAQLKRSPGPNFDALDYFHSNSDVAEQNYNPILHYIRYGKAEGRKPRPVPAEQLLAPSATNASRQPHPELKRIACDIPPRTGQPTVLLCSHVAGQSLFGGERSFVDMIDGLNALNFNVILSVPGVGNTGYFDVLRKKCQAIYVFDYGWWRNGQAINEGDVSRFAQIIADAAIDVVHANTIVLREPVVAARRMGVRSVVHVRELIHHDAALLELINRPAEEIVDWVWENADHVIANSEATRVSFSRPGQTPSLVYNTADFDELSKQTIAPKEQPLRVGLISSNLPKKGIRDFAEIAKDVATTHPDVRFHLIGPQTSHTDALIAQVDAGTLPKSLKLLGYRETPAQAVAELDVVLNLSNFKESFGRTVLEGMAAGRPAIVYDFGAPPEIVKDGQTGFVVPFRDTAKVAEMVRKYATDRDLLREMGIAARQDVARRFGPEDYSKQMRAAYDAINAATQKTVLPARSLQAPTPRSQMKIAYFSWHFPVPSETFVLNELRELRANGFDVRVFCKQCPYPDFKPDFDIEWERVDDADHLATRLTETGRNMVHSHFVYPTVTDMVWPACEKAKVPFTFIAHAQDIFRHHNDAANRIDEVAASTMCQKVFVPSRFHRKYLEKRGVPSDKMMINANGCDVSLYKDGRNPLRASRPFRRIIAVHRFTEKKGLEHLIRAGKLIEETDVRIELYGYGELEETYRDIIARENITNVHLCGPVKGREAMLDLFRESDFFACPSVRAEDGDMDGIPTVLMEAMAAGLPVLTTDLSGIPDLVEDGVTGFVCAANPAAIAARIRAYYTLPDAAVDAIIANAIDRILRDYDTTQLVENLLRVWTGETVDLLIVSWNNLPELSEVLRRLHKYTELPFHLVICDNGSDPETNAHLLRHYANHGNVTIVLNRENAFVGPGTNICLDHSTSDYAIYVCGKEGMTTKHGWEKPVVAYMNAHPDVGLAGTLCYSPSYLFGREYPTAQPLFEKFRNRQFALDNPDRQFAHVQGGFFAMRRKMVEQIGGFSTEVPHNSTDVEYSYFVESSGWKLGQTPGLIALYNKTRPGIFHRLDEHMGALHPPMLDDLSALDAIASASVHHCNACGKQSACFDDIDGAAICSHCGSDRRARALHRVLAESTLLFRRLPALGINVPPSIADFWTEQFQGRSTDDQTLAQELATNGRTDFGDARLDLVLLNDALAQDTAANTTVLGEAARLLKPEGTLIVSGAHDPDALRELAHPLGLEWNMQARFASNVSHYDWRPISCLTRL